MTYHTSSHPTITTWTKDDLGPRTADVTEQHQLIVRWDNQGYTRIHEDALCPLLRAAGYQLQQPPPLRIDGTWLVSETGGCNCNGGDAASSGAHEPHSGLQPELNLAAVDGFQQLGQYLDEAAALRSAPVANDKRCHACNSCTNPASCVISR